MVRERWGELTDDELDQIAGKRDQLVGKIQEKYGYTRDEAERQVDGFLEEVDSRGGNWSFVGMPGADLRLAGFSGVRMREADLTFAKLEGASMRDVDLVGASLHHADLSKCDLRGSDLSTVDPTTVRMHGAIITIDQTIIVAEALGLDVRME
jgi:uncharacterized protein YjbJ (UPF0337 family)